MLGTVPKACRPYRAKTKGKIERMVREVKESFLAWLSGQPLPQHPTLADYDALGRRWGSRGGGTAATAPPSGWSERRGLRSVPCSAKPLSVRGFTPS